MEKGVSPGIDKQPGEDANLGNILKPSINWYLHFYNSQKNKLKLLGWYESGIVLLLGIMVR